MLSNYYRKLFRGKDKQNESEEKLGKQNVSMKSSTLYRKDTQICACCPFQSLLSIVDCVYSLRLKAWQKFVSIS